MFSLMRLFKVMKLVIEKFIIFQWLSVHRKNVECGLSGFDTASGHFKMLIYCKSLLSRHLGKDSHGPLLGYLVTSSTIG